MKFEISYQKERMFSKITEAQSTEFLIGFLVKSRKISCQLCCEKWKQWLFLRQDFFDLLFLLSRNSLSRVGFRMLADDECVCDFCTCLVKLGVNLHGA